MASLSSINIRVGANLKEFSTKLQNAERQLTKFGKNMQKTGKNLSMKLTAPLVGLGAVAVKAFATQEQALAKLSAQITQSGQEVSVVLPQYQKFASELQKITTVGDEATLGLIQMAMTMGSNAPDIAAKNAIALSKALGVDLNSAIKMVTLAEKGEYTMLNRYVPALRSATTEAEKAAITHKLYSDGMAIAQAEADTSTGKMLQLKNTMGDLMEVVGGVISRGIVPLIEKLKSLAERFQNLTDKQVQTIVKIAGIAAAIGPVLFIVGKLTAGIGALTKAYGLFKIGMMATDKAAMAATGTMVKLGGAMKKMMAFMAANPVMLLVAALGIAVIALINYTNKTKEATKEQNRFNEAQEEFIALQDSNKSIQDRIKLLDEHSLSLQQVQRLESDLLAATQSAETKKTDFIAKNKKLYDAYIAAKKKGDEQEIWNAKALLKVEYGNQILKEKGLTLAELTNDERRENAIMNEKFISSLTENNNNQLKLVQTERKRLEALQTTTTTTDNLITSTNELTNAQKKLNTEFAVTSSAMNLGSNLSFPDTSSPDAVSKGAANDANNLFSGMTGETTDDMEKQITTADMLAGSIMNYSDALGESITNAKEFGNVIKQVAKDFIKASISKAIAAMIEKSIVQFGVFGAPLAIAGGSMVAGLFDKLIPQFATGTSFAPGGLAMVGERGAELVNLPRGSQVHSNDRLRGMNQNGGGQLVASISMDEFRVMLDRNTNRNQTRR